MLLQRQMEFALKVPLLLTKATALGFFYTLGDLYRDPRCPYGSKSSRHKIRLAIDVNLFRDVDDDGDPDYLTSTEDHRPLGEWWESIGGVWGGRFDDGNHYEAPWPGPWTSHKDGTPLLGISTNSQDAEEGKNAANHG